MNQFLKFLSFVEIICPLVDTYVVLKITKNVCIYVTTVCGKFSENLVSESMSSFQLSHRYLFIAISEFNKR